MLTEDTKGLILVDCVSFRLSTANGCFLQVMAKYSHGIMWLLVPYLPIGTVRHQELARLLTRELRGADIDRISRHNAG